MIIDLKELIDDDLIFNYFSHKVENAQSLTSSLKTIQIETLGYINDFSFKNYTFCFKNSK